MTGDPYEILGVPRDATAAQIKTAYRKLAKAHHSDVGGDDAVMRGINEAFEVLSDPEKRRRFDECGDADFDLEKVALDNLSALFAEALDKVNERQTDIIVTLNQIVRQRKEEWMNGISNVEDELARYTRLVRRIRHTGGGVDIFTVIHETKAHAARLNLKQYRLNLRVCDRVLEMLRDYRDEGEQPTLPMFTGGDAGNAAAATIYVIGGNRGGRSHKW